MSKEQPNLFSIILIPAIISNVITILRLILELQGFAANKPSDFTWWISLSLLIPIVGIYFAYALRNAEKPFRKFFLTLFLYALSVRIPTAILYGISGAMGWKTHYSVYGSGNYITGGLIPQLIIWPIITVVGGTLFGILVLILMRNKSAKPVSA